MAVARVLPKVNGRYPKLGGEGAESAKFRKNGENATNFLPNAQRNFFKDVKGGNCLTMSASSS